MKIYKESRICDKVFWTQYNILQTHKLKYNDVSHVSNVIITDVIFWLILKYMVYKKWCKNHVLVWKKKPLWEEFLGPFACEAEHDT